MTRSFPGTSSARVFRVVNWVSFSEMVSSAMWILSPVAALIFWIISGSLYCNRACVSRPNVGVGVEGGWLTSKTTSAP